MIQAELLPEGVYMETINFCAFFSSEDGSGWVLGDPKTGKIDVTWEDAKVLVPELVAAAIRAGLTIKNAQA